MTDKQIIKVLECLTGEMIPCKDCPYSANYTHFDCQRQVAKDALDLINRQKAEIERLENILLKFMDEVAKWEAKKGIDVSELPLIPICDEGRDIIDHYRARAIKEFAERLKEKAIPHYFDNTHFAVKVEEIDNLVKEMAGADGGS